MTYISDPDALADHLRARGVDYWRQNYGLTITVDIGELVDFGIDVHWLDDQVRFVAVTPLDIVPARLAEAALAIERVNAEIGFPVWRVVPSLSATYTVTLDHTGALSSRALECAMALLRLALVRDMPRFRDSPWSSPP